MCQVAEDMQRMGKCIVIGLQSTGEARTIEAVEVSLFFYIHKLTYFRFCLKLLLSAKENYSLFQVFIPIKFSYAFFIFI